MIFNDAKMLVNTDLNDFVGVSITSIAGLVEVKLLPQNFRMLQQHHPPAFSINATIQLQYENPHFECNQPIQTTMLHSTEPRNQLIQFIYQSDQTESIHIRIFLESCNLLEAPISHAEFPCHVLPFNPKFASRMNLHTLYSKYAGNHSKQIIEFHSPLPLNPIRDFLKQSLWDHIGMLRILLHPKQPDTWEIFILGNEVMIHIINAQQRILLAGNTPLLVCVHKILNDFLHRLIPQAQPMGLNHQYAIGKEMDMILNLVGAESYPMENITQRLITLQSLIGVNQPKIHTEIDALFHAMSQFSDLAEVPNNQHQAWIHQIQLLDKEFQQFFHFNGDDPQ